MIQFIQHHVLEMDETLVQHCVCCGTIVSDYRDAMVPTGTKLRGWPAGPIYVAGKNPIITQTDAPAEFVSCMKTAIE